MRTRKKKSSKARQVAVTRIHRRSTQQAEGLRLHVVLESSARAVLAEIPHSTCGLSWRWHIRGTLKLSWCCQKSDLAAAAVQRLSTVPTTRRTVARCTCARWSVAGECTFKHSTAVELWTLMSRLAADVAGAVNFSILLSMSALGLYHLASCERTQHDDMGQRSMCVRGATRRRRRSEHCGAAHHKSMLRHVAAQFSPACAHNAPCAGARH
jgi:hypothetical protein